MAWRVTSSLIVGPLLLELEVCVLSSLHPTNHDRSFLHGQLFLMFLLLSDKLFAFFAGIIDLCTDIVIRI